MGRALLTDLTVQLLGQRVGLTADAVQIDPQRITLGQRFITQVLTLSGQCFGRLPLGVGPGMRQAFLRQFSAGSLACTLFAGQGLFQTDQRGLCRLQMLLRAHRRCFRLESMKNMG